MNGQGPRGSSAKLPTAALLSMNGAKLVDSVNTPDPTKGTLHFMRSGFVVRQVATVARSMFVTTFGEGSNMLHLLAWANDTWGGGGFKDLNYLTSRGVSGEKGFQSTPGTPPGGAQVTYWTDRREQTFQFQRDLRNAGRQFVPL